MGLVQFGAEEVGPNIWRPFITIEVTTKLIPNESKIVTFTANCVLPSLEKSEEFSKFVFDILQTDKPEYYPGGADPAHFKK